MNNAANGMPWAGRTQAGACRGAGSELVPAAGHGILAAFQFRRNGMSASGFSFSETIATERRDYPEWHKGRGRYAIWMIPIDCPRVLAYLDQVTRQLADLLHPSQRQPHITLFVCGFEQERQVHNDDFTAAQLQQQIAALRALPLSATLQIGRPDSFASAAYLSVADPDGHMHAWRSALADGCSEIRPMVYVPHITLGLYRQRIRADKLQERLDEVHYPSELLLPVSRLEYATYSSADMFGLLECRQTIQLQLQAD